MSEVTTGGPQTSGASETRFTLGKETGTSRVEKRNKDDKTLKCYSHDPGTILEVRPFNIRNQDSLKELY